MFAFIYFSKNRKSHNPGHSSEFPLIFWKRRFGRSIVTNLGPMAQSFRWKSVKPLWNMNQNKNGRVIHYDVPMGIVIMNYSLNVMWCVWHVIVEQLIFQIGITFQLSNYYFSLALACLSALSFHFSCIVERWLYCCFLRHTSGFVFVRVLHSATCFEPIRSFT